MCANFAANLLDNSAINKRNPLIIRVLRLFFQGFRVFLCLTDFFIFKYLVYEKPKTRSFLCSCSCWPWPFLQQKLSPRTLPMRSTVLGHIDTLSSFLCQSLPRLNYFEDKNKPPSMCMRITHSTLSVVPNKKTRLTSNILLTNISIHV